MLTKSITEGPRYKEITKFFYDDHKQLVGINWGTELEIIKFYRVSVISCSICYLEETSLPYDDSNAEVGRRFILEFDVNDNLVKAGTDLNFNVSMDNKNFFQYDNRNNLISGQLSNGESFSINYSSIVDTRAFILENTYGKKLLRILEGPFLSGNGINLRRELGLSYNVSLKESQKHNFETLPITSTIREPQ